MPWAVLLLAAGSLAIPAPSIFLVPPYPSSQEDPIHISCMAPMAFLGANFTLYRGGHVVQLLQAPEDQAGVTFNVSASMGSEVPGGQFRCQYSVMGEHSQQQLSDLSQPVQVSFPVPTWILALSLSLAGAFLLLAVLVVFAVVARKVKVKNLQKKRERESCWAQVNYANTDMSFDNSLFAISKAKRTPLKEDPVATLDACPGSAGPRQRPTSTSSSPEAPEFSTFRACQ
ncbi:Protein HIDE1 [Heterocephalus glaber]|uniref:Protein HIDE1 n=1 Tax=Heterocephalus glaber TaxID=10181 RepID=G5BUI0_HETGA|nr:protein HIDE1 [Heterocephalus glaber]XP_012921461.1 protein HIDE1 [Heterocephalus glaber]XP_021100773.1 protein HIDE1 [Heterocephalus glaber]XP_021100774.1 protein HIDE1 [Heterocephalus glaber]XP_021100775.1 protein HIDE1 [Heterocephalus glaber]EHB12941.1 Protein HIDE1 [Heterocephalus glaber]